MILFLAFPLNSGWSSLRSWRLGERSDSLFVPGSFNLFSASLQPKGLPDSAGEWAGRGVFEVFTCQNKNGRSVRNARNVRIRGYLLLIACEQLHVVADIASIFQVECGVDDLVHLAFAHHTGGIGSELVDEFSIG